MFNPSAVYNNHHPESQILILEYGPNPTSDYYLSRQLAGPNPAIRVDTRITPDFGAHIADGTFVIIVRYLPRLWARYLLQNQARLSGVAYFMDDDLPAALGSPHLPLRYRFKIFNLFHRRRHILSRLCSEVWVSTQALAAKYTEARSWVIEPSPLILEPDPSTMVTYFYHGTASHGREWRWLVDIVSPLQRETKDLTFIAVGDLRIRKLFSGLPRVLVFHPMAWETYRDSLPAIHHDIGLAPVLPSAFNCGRTHTKFFDITRLGAAGIYSSIPPYAGFIRPGVDGLLVENDPKIWQETILYLATFPERRVEIVGKARQRAKEMTILQKIKTSSTSLTFP